MKKARVIAFYLPQFHPFPENDEWWGKGFTEWTNVGKAKALFRGHNQPKVPADLGYYDLRLKEVRQQQVDLAKEAGVNAFCYWHYWFGNGVQLMNSIIDDVLKTKSPDFPFCFGWANETWKAKQWNKDGVGDRILIEQMYPGENDIRAHYEYVRNFFKDDRYVRVEGKPFFLIYKPDNYIDVNIFIKLWNKWIIEDGIASGVYFVANVDNERDFDKYVSMGFNAVTPAHRQRVLYKHERSSILVKIVKKIIRSILKRPLIVSMDEVNEFVSNKNIDSDETVIPFLIPQWDHTPRSGTRGYLINNSSPKKFEKQVENVLSIVAKKQNKLILLKSWNEWAEGNYMEPDLLHGRGYIESLSKVIKRYNSK